MRTTENTRVKTATVKSGNRRVELDANALYFSPNTVPSETMKDLPIVASNFKKQLTDLGALIRGGDSERFVGLRLVAELPNGKCVSIRMKTLGANGLFALAAEATKLDIPESTYKGKTVKDYRVLFNNKKFMNTLTKRLEGVADLVANGNLTVTLSKDIGKWNIPSDSYNSEPFELAPKTI